ncbi:MAG: phosphatase PAP2 family protein [Alphaproteobacteria bacterium]|nr:phosphatase PAP2 family protein [Alphaproteobacteria bacterium]
MNDLRHVIASLRSHVEITLLTLWIALAAAAWSFLALASELQEGELTSYDRWLMQALREPGLPHVPVGPPWLIDTMRDFTSLGSVAVLLLLTTIVAVALLIYRQRAQAAVLAAAVVMANVSNSLLQLFYGRARPDFIVQGVLPPSHSFPSGHSAMATAAYFLLAMILASYETRRTARVFAFGVAAFLAILIGFSRVYLGVHWPSDVLAGWTLGGIWALLGALALRFARRSAR